MTEIEWIEREARKAEIALERAKRKPNVQDGEIDSLSERVRILHRIKDDVQRIKHGNWIEMKRGHYFKCSECRNPIPYRFGWMLYNNVIENNRYYNYCPNCGARMDGDE